MRPACCCARMVRPPASRGIASWTGTLLVALAGVMTGDLVLYMLGRRWGADVVNHRSVRWIVTPDRFQRLSRRFRVHGTWFCFFGRFLMGVRAAMCLTAGATHFPYWRFFLADFTGALLSVPLFVCLGYWFAGMIPTLQMYVTGRTSGYHCVGHNRHHCHVPGLPRSKAPSRRAACRRESRSRSRPSHGKIAHPPEGGARVAVRRAGIRTDGVALVSRARSSAQSSGAMGKPPNAARLPPNAASGGWPVLVSA